MPHGCAGPTAGFQGLASRKSSRRAIAPCGSRRDSGIPVAQIIKSYWRVNVAKANCCTANRGKIQSGKNFFCESPKPAKQGFRDLKRQSRKSRKKASAIDENESLRDFEAIAEERPRFALHLRLRANACLKNPEFIRNSFEGFARQRRGRNVGRSVVCDPDQPPEGSLRRGPAQELRTLPSALQTGHRKNFRFVSAIYFLPSNRGSEVHHIDFRGARFAHGWRTPGHHLGQGNRQAQITRTRRFDSTATATTLPRRREAHHPARFAEMADRDLRRDERQGSRTGADRDARRTGHADRPDTGSCVRRQACYQKSVAFRPRNI